MHDQFSMHLTLLLLLNMAISLSVSPLTVHLSVDLSIIKSVIHLLTQPFKVKTDIREEDRAVFNRILSIKPKQFNKSL